MRRARVVTAVRWFHRFHGAALGWIGGLLVALLSAAGPGEAVTLQPWDILIADSGSAAIIPVDPIGGGQTVVASGGYFRTPVGIAVAANGDLFVVDPGCCGGQGGVIRVQPVEGAAQSIQTVVASGGHFVAPPGHRDRGQR